MHVIAAKAVAFKLALADSFKTYQQQVVKNAKALWPRILMDNGIRLSFRRHRQSHDAG